MGLLTLIQNPADTSGWPVSYQPFQNRVWDDSTSEYLTDSFIHPLSTLTTLFIQYRSTELLLYTKALFWVLSYTLLQIFFQGQELAIRTWSTEKYTMISSERPDKTYTYFVVRMSNNFPAAVFETRTTKKWRSRLEAKWDLPGQLLAVQAVWVSSPATVNNLGDMVQGPGFPRWLKMETSSTASILKHPLNMICETSLHSDS